MSERVDQFCAKLRDRLTAIEGRVQCVKNEIQAMPAKADKVVRERLDQARTKLQAQKERVTKPGPTSRDGLSRSWPTRKTRLPNGRPSGKCES